MLAANPNFAESYNNLGVVISQTGKKKEAHPAFLKAVELRPDWDYAVYNLAISFLSKSDRASAQKQLNVLEKIDSKFAAMLRDAIWQKYVINVS